MTMQDLLRAWARGALILGTLALIGYLGHIETLGL